MRYLVLLYADESGFAKLSPEEMKSALASFAKYNEQLAKAGVLVHGEQLKPSAQAKSLRMKDGKVATTDGPFTESKEQLGGYYVLDVRDEREALDWARRCPIIYSGTVEVRELIPRPE